MVRRLVQPRCGAGSWGRRAWTVVARCRYRQDRSSRAAPRRWPARRRGAAYDAASSTAENPIGRGSRRNAGVGQQLAFAWVTTPCQRLSLKVRTTAEPDVQPDAHRFLPRDGAAGALCERQRVMAGPTRRRGALVPGLFVLERGTRLQVRVLDLDAPAARKELGAWPRSDPLGVKASSTFPCCSKRALAARPTLRWQAELRFPCGLTRRACDREAHQARLAVARHLGYRFDSQRARDGQPLARRRAEGDLDERHAV
jgi:hypothetical protein